MQVLEWAGFSNVPSRLAWMRHKIQAGKPESEEGGTVPMSMLRVIIGLLGLRLTVLCFCFAKNLYCMLTATLK